MEVKKAKREKIKVPIMITGASGSGKTVGALLVAKGIVEKMFPDLSDSEQWEKVGVIDTESKRSLLYADTTIGNNEIGEFLHLDLEPPFSVGRYLQAFELLKKSGVEVIVVDSMTHAWSGEGGILEEVERIQGSNSKMGMQAWSKVKPLEKQFLKLLTTNSVYVIGTSRTKQAYEMDRDESGKTKVVKLGLKPDQKDSLEYEFAIVFRMNQDHSAEATKDNSNLFNLPVVLSKEVGHQIYEWSSEGIDLEKVKQELISEVAQLATLSDNHEKQYNAITKKYGDTPLKDWNMKALEQLKGLLERVPMPENKEEVSEEKKEADK